MAPLGCVWHSSQFGNHWIGVVESAWLFHGKGMDKPGILIQAREEFMDLQMNILSLKTHV